MSEKFGSLNDPRPRPCEIGVCVHRVNAVCAHGWKLVPTRVTGELPNLICRLIQTKAARHNDQYLWPPLQDLVPSYANGVGSVTPEFIDAASNLHHFRHPVTATINGVYPFHAKN